MNKIKDFSKLGDLYSSIKPNAVKIQDASKPAEILPTNTNVYLPESAQPKVGEGFGVEKEELAKETGPEAADNFKKVTKKEDPGSSKKEMKKEIEDEEKEMEEAKMPTNAKSLDADNAAAKNTTPKEKIQERVDSKTGNAKYKKTTFTMPKSKFDQLYEDAVNGVPFSAGEEDMTPAAGPDAGAPKAPEAPMGEPEAEVTLSHDEAIQALEKVLAFLKKDVEHDIETGTLGDEEGATEVPAEGDENDEEEPVEEAIEAEDLGHAGVGSGAKSEQLKDGHKTKTVGSLKAKGAASEQGGPKGGDGTVQKAKDFDKGLQKPTGSNQVGNLKTNKGTDNAFE